MIPASIELLALCHPNNEGILHEGIREREGFEGYLALVVVSSSNFATSALESAVAAIVVATFVAIPSSAIWRVLRVSLVNESFEVASFAAYIPGLSRPHGYSLLVPKYYR